MKRFTLAALALLFSANLWAATCSVSEFDTLVTDSSGRVLQVPIFAGLSPTTQTVTATTPTAVSNGFGVSTRFLWIYCDEVMHIQVGTAPATGLTTDDMRIPSGGFWLGLVPTAVDDGDLKIAFCDADCL